MCGRGLPRWWVLPWEMLSICTCYSRLHWRWFRYVSPSSCTMWSSLVLARFRFLLDHVLVPCCSTCQFFTGTCVVLLLDHVSLLHWTTCHIIIGPRVHFLFDHASRCCPSMCHILYVHVAWWFPSTCQIFNSPRVVPWPIHVSCTGWSTCHIFIWSRGLSWFYRVQE